LHLFALTNGYSPYLIGYEQANLHHVLLGQHGGLRTRVVLEQLVLVLQLSLLHFALDQIFRCPQRAPR